MDLDTDQQRLEFAVNFAQTDIPALREGDWLNLCEDFFSFLRPVANSAVVVPGSAGILQSRSDAEALRKEMYDLLSEVVDTPEGEWELKYHPISFDLAVGISRERALTGRPWGGAGGVPWFMIRGNMRDRMLLNVFSLLCRESTAKIHRCGRSDCKRIFYRVRKQKFCSTRCQSRESVRRFRNKPENKTKESEQNHRKYKKQVEKTQGRPTKISRRLKK